MKPAPPSGETSLGRRRALDPELLAGGLSCLVLVGLICSRSLGPGSAHVLLARLSTAQQQLLGSGNPRGSWPPVLPASTATKPYYLPAELGVHHFTLLGAGWLAFLLTIVADSGWPTSAPQSKPVLCFELETPCWGAAFLVGGRTHACSRCVPVLRVSQLDVLVFTMVRVVHRKTERWHSGEAASLAGGHAAAGHRWRQRHHHDAGVRHVRARGRHPRVRGCRDGARLLTSSPVPRDDSHQKAVCYCESTYAR